MKNIIIFCLFAFIFVGCAQDSNLDAPRKFFNKNKIGTSPDYAVIKNGIIPDDHVMTVHGFADDLDACLKVVKAFNEDACKETGGYNCSDIFTCTPLNH